MLVIVNVCINSLLCVSNCQCVYKDQDYDADHKKRGCRCCLFFRLQFLLFECQNHELLMIQKPNAKQLIAIREI